MELTSVLDANQASIRNSCSDIIVYIAGRFDDVTGDATMFVFIIADEVTRWRRYKKWR